MRSAFLVVIALIAARDTSCGGVDSTSSGPNAPCTRDKDCKEGLACTRGVCVNPDASLPSDGGADVVTLDASDAGGG